MSNNVPNCNITESTIDGVTFITSSVYNEPEPDNYYTTARERLEQSKKENQEKVDQKKISVHLLQMLQKFEGAIIDKELLEVLTYCITTNSTCIALVQSKEKIFSVGYLNAEGGRCNCCSIDMEGYLLLRVIDLRNDIEE